MRTFEVLLSDEECEDSGSISSRRSEVESMTRLRAPNNVFVTLEVRRRASRVYCRAKSENWSLRGTMAGGGERAGRIELR